MSKDIEEKLLNKWESYTDEIDDKDIKKNVTTMLENQTKYLEEHDVLEEVAFPIIKNMLPSLVANDLFSVQPMRGHLETAESICKMANGLVKKGIVKGEYNNNESNSIFYIQPTYGSDDD